MRREYTLTRAQYDHLINQMTAEPLILLQCGMPRSQQEKANDAWVALGKELGFDGMTVHPLFNNPLGFTAEETP